ncbi:MAG: PEP-CTERM sorting domain-containing protein, partial [Tepidisphaeraceae bacterium]
SPFHQVPELATLTAITQQSSGNALPAITTATIPQLNLATMQLGGPPVPGGLAVGEYLFNVDNVTLSSNPGSGGNTLTAGETFGTANLDFLMTDSSSNSMVFYYWPTSYSTTLQNLYGMVIPTGPVDLTGFVSVFPGTPGTAEFTPISVTAVPEPASLGGLAVGCVAMLMRRRRTA